MLLIEDDAPIRRVLRLGLAKLGLAKEGFVVDEAGTGEEGRS